ncbi:hypothetical protein AB0C27_23510 [Nonomuraea sp. NPDC048882]
MGGRRSNSAGHAAAMAATAQKISPYLLWGRGDRAVRSRAPADSG